MDDSSHLNGGARDAACGTVFEDKMLEGEGRVCCGSAVGHEAEVRDDPPPSLSGGFSKVEEHPLIPMTLYIHRVKGLVLALLVEPHFLKDTASMEEVVS